MWIVGPVLALADEPTEVHLATVGRALAKEAPPAPGLWPTEHLPTRRAEAEAWLAAKLES